MITVKHWLATAALLLGACGDGSGPGMGGPGLPGAGGTGGPGVGGASGGGGCGCLDTVVSLMEGCQPSGTCTQQMAGMTAANVCYENGVKMQVTMSSLVGDTISMTMTVKKGSVCYSMVMNQSEAGDMTLIFKNPSGATVATIATTASAGDQTITCPGGAPAVLTDECNAQASSLGTGTPSASDCTDGTCSF